MLQGRLYLLDFLILGSVVLHSAQLNLKSMQNKVYVSLLKTRLMALNIDGALFVTTVETLSMLIYAVKYSKGYERKSVHIPWCAVIPTKLLMLIIFVSMLGFLHFLIYF